MANITTGTHAQTTPVTIVDGIPTTTTRDIAIAFGKRHDHVLAIVRQRMVEAGNWHIPEFREVSMEVEAGNGAMVPYPVIRMTEKGFMFVVQKFTGKKAVAVQIAYVDEFERMRNQLAQLSSNPCQLPADRTELAYKLASEAATQVQRTVFDAIMSASHGTGPDKWNYHRWLVSFGYDRNCENRNVPSAMAIEQDALVMSLPRLAKAIVEPGGMMPTNAELANLASACNQRLASRMERDVTK